MVKIENRADLYIGRKVEPSDDLSRLLTIAETIGFRVFGSVNVGLVTLPSKEYGDLELITKGAKSPLAVIYRPEELWMPLAGRTVVNDDRSRSKISKVCGKLTRDVSNQSSAERKKNPETHLKHESLNTKLSTSEKHKFYEVTKDSTLRVPIKDISYRQHSFIHNGDVEICLVADDETPEYSVLLHEKMLCEEAIMEVSPDYAGNKTNPHPFLEVPIMRVPRSEDNETRRRDFRKFFRNQTLPTILSLGPVEIR